MIITPKLTPEVLIETPRRGPAIPSPNGSKALYTCSTHTIGGDTLVELRLLDVSDGSTHRLTDSSKVHDATWLAEDEVVYLESREEGLTQLRAFSLRRSDCGHLQLVDSSVITVFPAPVRNLKVLTLGAGRVALTVVGRVDSNGNLFNEETSKKKSSVRVYDTFHFRFWDAYLQPQKYTIWYSLLTSTGVDDRWALENPVQNLLRHSPNIEAPSGVNDGFADASDSYDISEHGVVFTAQDPDNKNALHKDITNVYYVALDSWSGDHGPAVPRLIPVYRDESKGVYSNPRFSPDGRLLAFLKNSMERFQDTRLFLAMLDIEGGYERAEMPINSALDVSATVTGKEWDLVPGGFEFARDGHSVFIKAQDCGRVALYQLRLQPNATPKLILKDGSVTRFWPLFGPSSEKLLVTSTSFVEPSLYQVVDVTGDTEVKVVSSASQNGAKLGLSPTQVSEIYFEGGGDYCVHAWVIKPLHIDNQKKYPLCLFVHGGPESAANDAWSTRWNLATWAEQGYIVVAPNFTGSTGFGLEHTERIYGSWGGLPYKDLVKCVEHLESMPNLDLDNAVAAGASYGGYMMNWIQGQPLGRKFKAIVCHDGIFHLPVMMLQSDDGGGTEDFRGPPYIWDNLPELEKWNPARPDLLRNWKTPMLVIHSDRDFRCPVTEGIAAFNTLQALGIESRFVNFPDENHFVLREENSLQWHREVLRWVNKFSGVEP